MKIFVAFCKSLKLYYNYCGINFTISGQNLTNITRNKKAFFTKILYLILKWNINTLDIKLFTPQ